MIDNENEVAELLSLCGFWEFTWVRIPDASLKLLGYPRSFFISKNTKCFVLGRSYIIINVLEELG